MIKEAPETLEKIEMRSNSFYPILIKPRYQYHIREIAPKALAKSFARPTVIWRHDKSCLSREHVDQTTPEALEKIQEDLSHKFPPITRHMCMGISATTLPNAVQIGWRLSPISVG
jgi:hypothetical protein